MRARRSLYDNVSMQTVNLSHNIAWIGARTRARGEDCRRKTYSGVWPVGLPTKDGCVHHNAHAAWGTAADLLHLTHKGEARKPESCDGAKTRGWESARLC